MLYRKISISFIIWSVAILMLLVCVPHHHHGDRACVLMERCERDGAVNDCHTHHHDDEQGRHADERFCVFSSVYVVGGQSFSVQKWVAVSPLSGFLPFLSGPAPAVVEFGKCSFFADYHLYYKSALLTASSAFRAPPVA